MHSVKFVSHIILMITKVTMILCDIRSLNSYRGISARSNKDLWLASCKFGLTKHAILIILKPSIDDKSCKYTCNIHVQCTCAIVHCDAFFFFGWCQTCSFLTSYHRRLLGRMDYLHVTWFDKILLKNSSFRTFAHTFLASLLYMAQFRIIKEEWVSRHLRLLMNCEHPVWPKRLDRFRVNTSKPCRFRCGFEVMKPFGLEAASV